MPQPKLQGQHKCRNSSPIHFWPVKHLRDAVTREAINSDRTITSIMEELLAQRYKLPLRLSGSFEKEVEK